MSAGFVAVESTSFRKGTDIAEQFSRFSRHDANAAFGTQLVLALDTDFMTRRFHQLIAVWFVLQIVLPFTAPLQTLDLHDLFGGTPHGHSRSAPESSTTPTLRDTSGTSALGSLVGPAALRLCATIVEIRDVTLRRAIAPFAGPSAAPPVQHPVLRI
jgi:hypothetical protein